VSTKTPKNPNAKVKKLVLSRETLRILTTASRREVRQDPGRTTVTGP
jgi:hypothetical protein